MGAHSTCLSFLPNHSCVATAASFLTRLVTPTSCTDLQTDTSLLYTHHSSLMLVQPHLSQTADMKTNTSLLYTNYSSLMLVQPHLSQTADMKTNTSPLYTHHNSLMLDPATYLCQNSCTKRFQAGNWLSVVSCCVVFVFHALFSVLLLLLSVCLWNGIYLFFTFQNCFVCAFSKQIFVPFEMVSASLFLDSSHL